MPRRRKGEGQEEYRKRNREYLQKWLSVPENRDRWLAQRRKNAKAIYAREKQEAKDWIKRVREIID